LLRFRCSRAECPLRAGSRKARFSLPTRNKIRQNGRELKKPVPKDRTLANEVSFAGVFGI